MTTATIPPPAPRRATLHTLDPEPVASPRRGLYIAFERIGLGWRWRCLRCGTAGTGHTDELALAAAAAHPCADKEVQA
jgi:hypothetical protein